MIKKLLHSKLAAILLCTAFFLSVSTPSNSQCTNSFAEGGTVTPVANGPQTVNVGSGTYLTANVHIGGIYTFDHCASTPASWSNSQITITSSSAVLVYADNSTTCPNAGTASATWTANNTYSVTVASNINNCAGWDGTSATLTYVCAGPGNPAVFGNFTWNVYGFNTGNGSGGANSWNGAYSGTFNAGSALNFTSTNYWAGAQSPSAATFYSGCEIGNNNHSWTAKRQGFTCGAYAIDIDRGEYYELWINGSLVASGAGGGAANNVWTGVLDANSTVEFRVAKGSSSSLGTINVRAIANNTPLAGGNVGVDQTICLNGDPAAFTSFADASGGFGPSVGGTYTYAWTQQNNCSGPIGNVGANSNVYDPSFLNSSACFVRSVTDACGNTAISNTITITAVPQPAITLLQDTAFCASGSTVLSTSVTGGTGPGSYQWQELSGGTSTVVGPNTGTYTTPVNTTTKSYVAAYIPALAGCDVTTDTITVTIEPAIGNNILPDYERFCGGGDAALIDGPPATGNPGLTYQWEESTNNGGSWNPIGGATFEDYDPAFEIVTKWYRRVVKGILCSDISNPHVVNVLSLPAVNSVTHTDASCFGTATGSIVVSGNGTNGGIWYSVDSGFNYQRANTFNSLPADSYYIYIKDDSSCVNVFAGNPEVIGQPALLVVTASDTDASCSGVNDGAVYGVATGGTLPYLWSINSGPNQSTGDFVNYPAGNYTVLVRDAKGCIDTEAITIGTKYNVTASQVSQVNVSCFGGNNGEVVVALAGGVLPYQYSINGITYQTVDTFKNLSQGNYAIILKDAKGCSDFLNVTITQPALLTVQIDSVHDILCNGNSSGSIWTSVTGGTAPYTYLWSNSFITDDIANIPSGTYNLTVTDANGCTGTIGTTISQPVALFAVVASYQDILCNGDSTGYVDISVSGGVPPYSFAWSNGALTEDIINIPAGIYTITVTDNNGCTLSITQPLTEPNVLSASVVTTNAVCFNGTGNIDVTVTGGALPYTFLWSSGATTEDIALATAGSYILTITDKNGCSTQVITTVTQPADMIITAVITDVLCTGTNTGAIDITVSGGAGPYNFVWTPTGALTEDISNIAGGSYTVVATDQNGCTKSATFVVNQPALLQASGNVGDALCFGGFSGTIDVTVYGGTIPYTFSWSNGAALEDLNNIQAGNYTDTIRDGNGCSVILSFVVNEPLAITSSIAPVNVTCNGLNNGSADLTVTGGTAPYTFLWSNFSGSEDVNNLGGGKYVVIITDSKGCTKRDSVTIVEPGALLLSTTVTQISCFNSNNGAIDLSVAGGTPNYSYQWSNNANNAITEDVSSLSGGTYAVTVTDANNCTAVASAIISNPLPLNDNYVVTTPRCYGDANGSVNLIVSGGTPGYTYAWDNGDVTEDLIGITVGTYKVTVTDANGCTLTDSVVVGAPTQLYTSGFITNVTCFGASNGFVDITAYGGTLPYTFQWSANANSSITEDINTVSGGNYTVTVTDGNGCTSTGLYVVYEPSLLTLNATATPVSCYGANDGQVASNSAGGLPPYEYLWNTFSTDSSISNLGPGLYTVMLTDSNGCNTFDTVTVTSPSQILTNGVVTNASCSGVADGAIDLTTTGGTGTYTFSWSSGASTEDVTALAAGKYKVTVTDASGCSVVDSFEIKESVVVQADVAVVGTTCFGGSNAFISVDVTGGNAPYTYLWNNGQKNNTASNLAAGTYTLTVTDAAGCSIVVTDSVQTTRAINISVVTLDSKCSNKGTGSVTVNATGGQAPFTYQVNGVVQANNVFSALLPGTYNLLVRDANGCENVTSFVIQVPSPLTVDLIADKFVILSGMEVQLTANVQSDTTVLNYIWTPSGTFDFSACGDSTNCPDPKAAPLITTIYTVTVLNADSCTATDTVLVVVNAGQSQFMPTAFSPNGDGLNDRFEFDILGAVSTEVTVFNRWGQMVYSNPTQPNGITGTNGWDGTFKGQVQPYDTYVYIIKVKYFDGREETLTSTISLMQ
jgi:gliding motility-associated-like protein